MTEDRIKEMNFSNPYMEENSVLVVPLKNKKKFLNLSKVKERRDLKIGAAGAFANLAHQLFPFAEISDHEDSGQQLKEGDVDAFLDSQSFSFAWCVLNPGFVVIDYQGRIGKNYFSYVIRSDSLNLVSFLKSWLILKDQSGFRQEMIDYWLKGKGVEKQESRWSILNDVILNNESRFTGAEQHL